jgi:carbonic anhydrase
VGAALEYAVGGLRVQHVVVCGHTHCGAVKALDTPFDLQRTPNLARWLEHLRPAQTSVDARVSFAEPASRHLAIVEQSVLDQLRNLETYPMVREALAQKRVQLHGWVYNLEIGRLSYFDSDAGRFIVEGSEPGNPDNR